jgi:hypothetical protein
MTELRERLVQVFEGGIEGDNIAKIEAIIEAELTTAAREALEAAIKHHFSDRDWLCKCGWAPHLKDGDPYIQWRDHVRALKDKLNAGNT